MNPGTMVNRNASTCSAFSGRRRSEINPTALILPFRIMMRPGENLSAGLRMVPASTTRARSLTPATQMPQDFAKVAAAFAETFLGFLAIASERSHDYGELELAAACIRKFLCLFGVDAKDFTQHLNA